MYLDIPVSVFRVITNLHVSNMGYLHSCVEYLVRRKKEITPFQNIYIYTGQKKLSPTCIFSMDKVQKHSDLSYCNFLLDVNFQTQFSTK